MTQQSILIGTVSQQAPSFFNDGHILNYQEAKARLQTLLPGTEEHLKLQDMLTRTASIAEISLPGLTYKVNTFSDDCRLLGGFGSSEHVDIGEEVSLQGLPKGMPLLVLGNNRIQFQYIVALAGDFYGVAGEAISLPGGTEAEKTMRFEKAFKTLAEANHDELQMLLVEINHECRSVKHSNLPHHCYSSHMMERDAALTKIKADIGALLADNSDHFSENAREAYFIGHNLAVSTAREAGRTENIEGLKRAYAYDAFACHFLTDLFAAGHIRNQRGPLESFLILELKFSPDHAKALAGILTAAQHEKDGSEGLNVSNEKGDYWRAFGDGSFFTPKNRANRDKVIKATQQSVDEIYKAYLNPDSQEPSVVGELIPHVTSSNPLPIYSIDQGLLFVYHSNKKIEIKSKFDYVNKVITQEALRHLPEEYVNGYIDKYIKVISFDFEIPTFVGKIIVPRMEHFTGVIWHMVGLATYHQVRKGAQELNEKIYEMAGGIMSANDDILEILEQVKVVRSQLTQLLFESVCDEIKFHIERIKNIQHQEKIHPSRPLSEKTAEDLWDAYIGISRVFHQGTVDGQNLLLAYRRKLEKESPAAKPLEIAIKVTLWFRQMIDYQAQALYLHTMLQIRRNAHQPGEIQNRLAEFEASIMEQIEANKAHIEESLIYESQPYIRLQLEKSKTRQLMRAILNS